VAGDAIAAAVGHAHREVDHLLGHRIERARRHDLLDAVPGALEARRIVRQIFPEIVHVLDAPGAFDVVEHGADVRYGVAIFDRAGCAHDTVSSAGPRSYAGPRHDATLTELKPSHHRGAN
jgi:hypothetical protein